MGITGKLALWRTLRALADTEPRLDPVELDRLVARAAEQRDRVEQLRLQVSADVLGAG